METNRKIWERPWGYKEGFVVAVTILLLGFILEYSTNGAGVENLLSYPNNVYIATALVSVLTLSFIFKRNSAVIEWLSGVPAAISSVGVLLLVSLLMGLTLQYDRNAPDIIRKLGLSHVITSWPYLLANLFILTSLGYTTIKNLAAFKRKKTGIIVSHLGLWIVLFAANFGSPQVQRLQMEIPEGGISNTAIDRGTNQVYTMPFAIKLIDFVLEEYNPKLVLVNNKTGRIYQSDVNNSIEADTGATGLVQGWTITVEKYIYTSAKAGSHYYFINEPGAAPSAFVNASKNNQNIEGWVSCGSFNRPYESLRLNEEYSLIMLFPEPKEFTSIIEIFRDDEDKETVHLQVNKPTKSDGWKIYQLSYDSELGRWSNVTVLELIKDPWLPLVYFGIFLMLAGAVYIFWVGSKNRSTNNN